MRVSEEKPKKKKMGFAKKVTLSVLGLAVLILLIYIGYCYIHFISYDEYKQYLSSYEYEEGTTFAAISEASPSVDHMILVAENDDLKLYTNQETAVVAVYDKRNGETIYSNPVNADDDPIANKVNKNYLKSQFLITYYNKNSTVGTYDSYSMAVERGQIQTEAIQNGIRYIYDVGDHSTNSTGIVPIFITPEKMEEIQSHLSERDAASIRRYYVNSKTSEGMLELNGVAQRNKKTIQKIEGFLEQAEFTQEDYNEQMGFAGLEQEENISFKIALDYRLDEDGLNVSLPTCAIEEFGGGASGVEEDGYMVVPNGSGSLIHFNNGKTEASDYTQYVYNIDPLVSDKTQLENTEAARLALFGICRENSSVLATIEDGASLAFLTSGVSGTYCNYNYTYSTFLLRGYDILSMYGTTGNESDLPIVEKDLVDVNITVKYTMLTEEYKGYSGLANYYREKLMNEGTLQIKKETGDIPFYYDVVGGVKKTAFLLGSQYLTVYPMTTFEEAGEISTDLSSNGITNQVMNFSGWFNGGYYHDVADKVKIIRKLGGKSGLEELSDVVQKNGGTFFADTALQNVTYISKRYSMNFETSKYYGAGYVAYSARVNPSTLRKMSTLGYSEVGYLMVSPKFLTRYVDDFVKEMKNIDIEGISLRDLGDELHSDKKRTNMINREEALDVVLAQFDKLDNTDKSLMVSGGNDYSFPYVSNIINVPINDNDYFIVDEDIPLYEMILHGSINYCGDLINYYDNSNLTDLTLNLIEYGSSPHYIFTGETANEMKYTGLMNQYSTKYEIWKDDAIAMYQNVNQALKTVQGETIVNHEILSGDVRKVTYSNGAVFYINYGAEDITVDGVLIPAKSYEMEEM